MFQGRGIVDTESVLSWGFRDPESEPLSLRKRVAESNKAGSKRIRIGEGFDTFSIHTILQVASLSPILDIATPAPEPRTPMPLLPNPRHEAFAQARAQGARLEIAYEDAGFAAGQGHACRLAAQPAVAARIAEIREEQADLHAARPQAVIAALLKVAKANEAVGSAASIKEVRLTLLEVDRLREALDHRRENELRKVERG
jgi:hypothetical protein